MAWLDPMEFVEEINSFWYFDWNSKTFAFEIIALADWGCQYVELGFCYPVPMFPNYLFSGISKSLQVTGQAPLKLDSIQQLSSDVRGPVHRGLDPNGVSLPILDRGSDDPRR